MAKVMVCRCEDVTLHELEEAYTNAEDAAPDAGQPPAAAA